MSTNSTAADLAESLEQMRGGEGTVRREVCARCGHMTPTCEVCGQATRFLGGYIDGRRYCHTFAEQPSCYTLNLREEREETPG